MTNTKVTFSFRFIIDRNFFDKVMKQNPKSFLALMYISSASLEYNRAHNLMSEKIRSDIIEKNPKYNVDYIKSSLNKINEPEEIEKEEDEIIRNIKYAIHYTKGTKDKITPICILTSDDMKDNYEKNPHLKEIKNVIIKSGNDAISLLEEYKELVFSN